MSETLTTARLILRRWCDEDRLPFQAINADPRGMEFFPSLLTTGETNLMVERIEQHFDLHGFGLFAAELIEAREFISFVGLNVPSFEAPFMPAVEIGWRLAASHWNRGLATEGARAVACFAFETLGLSGLVSLTTAGNLRSRRVMEKIGMAYEPADDSDHPRLPEGHPLRRRVLDRLSSPGLIPVP